MDDATELVLENQNVFIDTIHRFISLNFPENTVLIFQIGVKTLLLVVIFLFLDWFQRKILFNWLTKKIIKAEHDTTNALLDKNVIINFLHLLPLGVCYLLVPQVFYHHPKSFNILDIAFSILLVIFITRYLISLLTAYIDIKNKSKSYRTVAVKSFLELIKILIIIISGFIIISILFNLSSAKIFTFLGAIMAVILLIFRDPILGFVAGINIASSKQIKIGDKVFISKYNIEGEIIDISLVFTKIKNSDKTISTIPTYDLVAVEIKNFEAMLDSNTKRVKRAIFLNPSHISFASKNEIDELLKVELFTDFLNYQIKTEGNNFSNLTNVGLLRLYLQYYLENHENISKDDTILVRNLEQTAQGLPLELYCFTKTSDFKEHENIQSQIFEHIFAVVPYFQLQINYTST